MLTAKGKKERKKERSLPLQLRVFVMYMADIY
jgi:hypothetical protein